MRVGTVVSLAMALAMLAGCGTSPFNSDVLAGKPYPANPVVTYCDGASCDVTVTVAILLHPIRCSINVDPPILDLSKGQASKTITWTIKTPDVSWPGQGDLYHPIQFEANGQDAFSHLDVTNNIVSVAYMRPGSDHHRYAYGVNVKHPVLAKICGIDPFMQD